MRHVGSAARVPAGLPVYVFGAGAGGLIVHDALVAAGVGVEGFVDDRAEGPCRGRPVFTSAAFAARTRGAATVVIASRHWRAIGRQLAALGTADVVDGSHIIWRTGIGAAADPDRHAALEASLMAATGRTIGDLVAEVAAHRRDPAGPVGNLLAIAGPAGVYVEGTGSRARAIRTFVNDLPGLHVVGHIHDDAPGVVDHLDLTTWDVFLEETPAAEDPVVVVTEASGLARMPDLRRRGFRRLVAWPPAVAPGPAVTAPAWTPPDARTPVLVLVRGRDRAAAALSVASVLDQTHPDTICVLYDVGEDAPAVAGLARVRVVAAPDAATAWAACGGDLIGMLAAGRRLRPDAVATAVTLLASAQDAGAVLDLRTRPGPLVQGTGIDLLDHLFGRPSETVPDGLYRRAALAEFGPADAMDPFERVARLAIDTRILGATLSDPGPAQAPPQEDPALDGDRFRARVAALGRLFAEDGPFGLDPVLWTEALVRQFAQDWNRRPDGGARTGPGSPGRMVPPPLPIGVYDRLAAAFDARGQLDHTLGIRDAGRHFGDALFDALACQSAMKRPGATNAELLARQTGWAARHAPFPPVVLPLPDRTGPIRVGYLCPDAAATYVAYQILPFVAHHDRSRVNPICYVDYETPEVRRAADGVRLVRGLSDAAFRDLVRADGIDILVDLTGFGPGNRFRAMGERCAPIQVSYANHAATTGVPNVDHILADAIAVPPDLDPFFTETVHRLPGSFFCFDFAGDAFPDPGPIPTRISGRITFGCFGGGAKFNDALLGIWAELLHRTPGSRLLVCNPGLGVPGIRTFMERRFARHGIAPDRLWLKPGASREEIKRLYREVDVSLDTWPYCGGNTIAESLMMGVPVVTLLGETFAARYGASLLVASGCADLVAPSPEAYVETARALATDPDRLRALRGSLRGDMRTHGFSDSAAFAAKLEDAFVEMMARHTPGT